MATKMIERHYSLSWRDFTRVPVEHLMTVLERERNRVLADGNQQVLVDLDYDDENRARVHLVGIRPETPAEQSKREAKEAEQQERITAGNRSRPGPRRKYWPCGRKRRRNNSGGMAEWTIAADCLTYRYIGVSLDNDY
jgi:hypothetical protein